MNAIRFLLLEVVYFSKQVKSKNRGERLSLEKNRICTISPIRLP